MGERRLMQEALVYGFSLERHVPHNHLLRRIDCFVDLSEVRMHLEPYYNDSSSFDRSQADDTDADRRLRLRRSVRASIARRPTSIWRSAGSADWGSKRTCKKAPLLRPISAHGRRSARSRGFGRTIEDPYDRLAWIALVRSRACDGNARTSLKKSAIDCGRRNVMIH
jgi:hypothetical protein